MTSLLLALCLAGEKRIIEKGPSAEDLLNLKKIPKEYAQKPKTKAPKIKVQGKCEMKPNEPMPEGCVVSHD